MKALKILEKMVGDNLSKENINKVYKKIPSKSARLKKMEKEVKVVSKESGKLISSTYEEFITYSLGEIEFATVGLFELKNGFAFCGNSFLYNAYDNFVIRDKTLCNAFDTLSEAKQELGKQRRMLFFFKKVN